MGTPMACIYAPLYFAWKEEIDILPKFKTNLPFYGRFIDDVMGIWIPGFGKTYKQLCRKMDNFGPDILKWIPSKLCTSVVMLDLSIHIDSKGLIQHSTYQKELNLYAYVPRSSVHPPGIPCGLIISQL